jgi:hypothetical protein
MARDRTETEQLNETHEYGRRPERATNAPPIATPNVIDVTDDDDRIVFSSWDAPLVPERSRR